MIGKGNMLRRIIQMRGPISYGGEELRRAITKDDEVLRPDALLGRPLERHRPFRADTEEGMGPSNLALKRNLLYTSRLWSAGGLRPHPLSPSPEGEGGRKWAGLP